MRIFRNKVKVSSSPSNIEAEKLETRNKCRGLFRIIGGKQASSCHACAVRVFIRTDLIQPDLCLFMYHERERERVRVSSRKDARKVRKIVKVSYREFFALFQRFDVSSRILTFVGSRAKKRAKAG